MSPAKKVAKCSPKLPKSMAREYSLNAFVKSLKSNMATAVYHDEKFKPEVNECGWCPLKAKVEEPAVILPHCCRVINCGFEMNIPSGMEMQFRQINVKLMLLDGTDQNLDQRPVRVNVVNLGWDSVVINSGDVIGEMCVRPTNNIPIIVEELE